MRNEQYRPAFCKTQIPNRKKQEILHDFLASHGTITKDSFLFIIGGRPVQILYL